MKYQRGNSTVFAAIGGLVVGGAVGWFLGMQQGAEAGRSAGSTQVQRTVAAAPTPAPKPKEPPAKYGFEGELGWKCGEDEGSLACKGAGHTNQLHKEGLAAMKLNFELLGASKNHRSGEVWVDVNNVPPAGATGPVSLANRTLTAWVYAAPGSLGDPERPNGLQLFVKDGDWTPKYGPWQDVQEGQWAKVSFEIGPADAEFDPSVINAIGLKLASGEGSKAEFKGEVYLDAVSW